MLAFAAGCALLVLAIALIDLEPKLKHLKVAVLSGSTSGNYHAIVERIKAEAKRRKGRIKNIPTKGSVDNLQRLAKNKDTCKAHFALVQDGLSLEDQPHLELLARMTTSEVVFFLGKNADQLHRFSQLSGLRIGVGPKGSGTDRLARQLFASRGLSKLQVKLENLTLEAQMRGLESGSIDLGVYVIGEDARFIERAVAERGMQIASFDQVPVVARQLPFLRAGILNAGLYDPVRVLPAQEKHVLRVDQLVLGNGCASRSKNVGMFSLLAETFPGLIYHNQRSPNATGLPLADGIRDFLREGEPGFLDRYIPWLVDIVPVSNLGYMVMVISLLFNVMGGGHRFRLWRLDAARVALEADLVELFGEGVIVGEIVRFEPDITLKTPEKITRVEELIRSFESLRTKVRSQAVSMLVPMGQEMGYRYQESLVAERIDALRQFRTRLGEE